MDAYYKKGIGSSCRAAKCSKSRWRGEDIGYVIFGATYCGEHAVEQCQKYDLEFPGVLPEGITEQQKELLTFLQKHLRLVTRSSGGCPEENFPSDQDLYLVLCGEVISEVRLND